MANRSSFRFPFRDVGERRARRRKHGAMAQCWFREDAHAHIARAGELVSILGEQSTRSSSGEASASRESCVRRAVRSRGLSVAAGRGPSGSPWPVDAPFLELLEWPPKRRGRGAKPIRPAS